MLEIFKITNALQWAGEGCVCYNSIFNGNTLGTGKTTGVKRLQHPQVPSNIHHQPHCFNKERLEAGHWVVHHYRRSDKLWSSWELSVVKRIIWNRYNTNENPRLLGWTKSSLVVTVCWFEVVLVDGGKDVTFIAEELHRLPVGAQREHMIKYFLWRQHQVKLKTSLSLSVRLILSYVCSRGYRFHFQSKTKKGNQLSFQNVW